METEEFLEKLFDVLKEFLFSLHPPKNPTIIGYGHMGKIHSNELKELLRRSKILETGADISYAIKIGEIGVYDIKEEARILARSNGYRVYDNLTEILLNSRLIIICVPTSEHKKVFEEIFGNTFLYRSMDILCEKPVTASIEEWNQVLLKKPEKINIFANYECMNPVITCLKEKFWKYLEKVDNIEIFWMSMGGKDNDYIRDLGSHIISVLLYLFGEGDVEKIKMGEQAGKFLYKNSAITAEVLVGYGNKVRRIIGRKGNKKIFSADLVDNILSFEDKTMDFKIKTVYNLWERYFNEKWIPDKEFISSVWRYLDSLY